MRNCQNKAAFKLAICTVKLSTKMPKAHTAIFNIKNCYFHQKLIFFIQNGYFHQTFYFNPNLLFTLKIAIFMKNCIFINNCYFY